MKYSDIVEGKTYRIREWDDMAKEFVLDSEGDIAMPGDIYFVRHMKHLCGTKVTIAKKIGFPSVTLHDNRDWGFASYMLEPIFTEPVDDVVDVAIHLDEFLKNILKL